MGEVGNRFPKRNIDQNVILDTKVQDVGMYVVRVKKMATGPQQLSMGEAQNVVMEVKVAETDASKGCLSEGRGECADVEKVLCFCGSDCQSGEMPCCKLCSGWFHFQCM